FFLTPAELITGGVLMLTAADYVLLFFANGRIQAARIMQQRFSLGDENPVTLTLSNTFPFQVRVMMIDEEPAQFQERNFRKHLTMAPKSRASLSYTLRPV